MNLLYNFLIFTGGGLLAAVFVHLLLKHFFQGYLVEKGKNLATKEDIATITNEIEHIKTQYAVLLEERRATHQLRLAAIDRRMQAHQEAFALWREILRTVHSAECNKTAMKCQEWWEQNCLYLEHAVREAFVLSMSCAQDHAMLLQDRSDAENVHANWAKIIAAGPIILQAVQLLGLTAVESAELMKLGT